MRPTISLLLTSFFCLLISACVSEASAPKTPQAHQPTAVSTALFQIIKSDGTSVGVTLADLKTLPPAQVSVDGKVEEGPKLLDILAFAQVTDFTEVTLTGSSNPVTLTRGFGVLYPFAGHLLFGMIGGLLAALAVSGIRRYSQKSP